MKKTLLLFILVLGIFFVGNLKLGAKMNETNVSSDFTQVRAAHILVKTEAEAKDLKTKILAGEIKFEDVEVVLQEVFNSEYKAVSFVLPIDNSYKKGVK